MSEQDSLLRRPRVTLVFALVLTLISVALLSRMRPETSIAGLLDPSDPSVTAMAKVLDRFPIAGEMLVLASLPSEASADEEKLLQFGQRFEALASSEPAAKQSIAAVRYRPPAEMRKFVERVIVPHGLDYLDDPSLAALMKRLTRAGMDEQLARNKQALSVPGPAAGELGKVLSRDPLRLHEFLLARLSQLGQGSGVTGADAFFSPDHRSLLLRISGTSPPGDLQFSRTITGDISRIASAANEDGLRIDMTGAYAVAAHSAAAIRTDAIEGTITSVVGIAAVFWLFQRRPLRQFLFAFVPMAVGLLWGFGAYAAWHTTFTPLAAVVGGALGGIGIDYFVFFLAHYGRNRTALGHGAGEATLAQLRRPLLAAWLTSAIGFLAVAWSPIRVLRDFAIVGTLALLGAYVAVVWLLPALLSMFDRSTRDERPMEPRVFVIRHLGLWIARHARMILVASCCVWVVLAVGLISRGRSLLPDANLLVLHPRPNPPIDAQRYISDRMGIAPGTIQLYLHADSSDALLKLAHEVDRRLESPALTAAGKVGSFGVASLLPDPAVVARRRASIDAALPDRVAVDLRASLGAAGFRVAAFEGYITFVGKLIAPATAAPDVASLGAYPEVAATVIARDATSASPPREALTNVFFSNPLDRRDARDAAIGALSESLNGLDGVTITGMGAINAHVESAIYRDLPRLVLAALACIAVCLLIHFRSIKLGLLAIVPTIVSITVVLSFMNLTAQPLNLVNMVMVPLLLGIDVDYSILTISAWTRAKSKGDLVRAFPATFAGVMTCVATTIVGFGSLATTSIPAVRSLGVLITVGVLTCLLAQAFVLWPILHLMPRSRHGQNSYGLRAVNSEKMPSST